MISGFTDCTAAAQFVCVVLSTQAKSLGADMRHNPLPVDRMAKMDALAQSILDNFRNERVAGGAFSEEYKANAHKFLDIIFPEVESIDATYTACRCCLEW